jgi:hypothetical protein
MCIRGVEWRRYSHKDQSAVTCARAHTDTHTQTHTHTHTHRHTYKHTNTHTHTHTETQTQTHAHTHTHTHTATSLPLHSHICRVSQVHPLGFTGHPVHSPRDSTRDLQTFSPVCRVVAPVGRNAGVFRAGAGRHSHRPPRHFRRGWVPDPTRQEGVGCSGRCCGAGGWCERAVRVPARSARRSGRLWHVARRCERRLNEPIVVGLSKSSKT